jgi:short-subunit dehydrogenase
MERGWAVVTGASGGIGAEFAKALAARGYRVLAVARGGDALARVASELASGGAVVETLAVDLATADGVRTVAEKALALGTVAMLVNNAGLSTSGRFLEQSAERELQSVRVNVEALYTLTRALLPKMVEQKRGGIVNIASIVGFQPVPYWTTYAATKAFVLSFGEGLAHELRGSGVRVLTVCPGFTKTGLYAESGVPGLAGRLLPHSTPESVVRSALAAYDRRRVVEIVGVTNRLLAWAAAFAPRAAVRWLMGTMFRPRAAS